MAILTAMAAILSIRFFHPNPRVVSEPPPKAFLNAKWGMGAAEVQKVNGMRLEKTSAVRPLYRINERIKDRSRYQIYGANDFSFLGRQATLTYVFF